MDSESKSGARCCLCIPVRIGMILLCVLWVISVYSVYAEVVATNALPESEKNAAALQSVARIKLVCVAPYTIATALVLKWLVGPDTASSRSLLCIAMLTYLVNCVIELIVMRGYFIIKYGPAGVTLIWGETASQVVAICLNYWWLASCKQFQREKGETTGEFVAAE